MDTDEKMARDDIRDGELAASVRRELMEMEAAVSGEARRLEGKKSKKAKAKRSGMGVVQATLRYGQGDKAGAIAILKESVRRADESMGEKQPYRFYLHAVLADWLSEQGEEIEEAKRHIEIAWTFVTTEPTGKVYLEEVRERKAKVEARMK